MSQVRARKTFLQKYQDVMPTGAGALCLIQIFSTLSYSVLYSTLILYATKGLHMSDTLATSITGSFIALNYFLHLIGGSIGGRYLSYRSLFCVGMVAQVIGCILISTPDTTHLYWGLATYLGGSGLNVTCINCMVTQLFEPDDKRRESAFLWNYSGMNIGFFIGFSLGGYFHLEENYHQLFLLSALGNALAVLLVFLNWKKLSDRDTAYVSLLTNARIKAQAIGVSLVILLVLTLRVMLQHTTLCNQLIMVIGAMMLALMFTLSMREREQAARNKMFAYIILGLSSVIFWTLYQIAPMGLNLFIDRNVDRHILGFLIAPQWIQNINTIVIIIGGPLLSITFTQMRERGINISIPLQFSLSLTLIGIAFAILPLGISMASATTGMVGFGWVFGSYILQSIGELFISPIGYAMVGELAPLHLRGLMMGIWMMITGLSAIFSDHFSKLALGDTLSTDPLITNAGYSHTFGMVGWSAIGAGVLLFLAVPALSRLTLEKKRSALEDGISMKELEQEMA